MPAALCFIDMPFGKKTDLASGVEIDFDRIYTHAIKPAIESVGLESLRGDEETSGGIIHAAMFARLLLAEYVVADLTLANPNVFYELGIRHTAMPFTTVPIFATTHALPFDVALIRAVPYELEDGILSKQNAEKLKTSIADRLKQAIDGSATNDSPLFQLLPDFPGISLEHEATEAFQDRVKAQADFAMQLQEVMASQETNEKRCQGLLAVQEQLGAINVAQRNVVVTLMLSYRDVEAWNEMIALVELMADHDQNLAFVRQQWALALNRRNEGTDRNRAIELMLNLKKEQGPDPETLGILGRVYKDKFQEAKQAGSIMASAALDDAIATYRQGFESDPRDYYPGVNAINLLVQKGDADAMKQANELLPLVSFAVARSGGATSSDYWVVATAFELACIGKDWSRAINLLSRVLSTTNDSWKIKTTCDNLVLLQQAFNQQNHYSKELEQYIEELTKRENYLKGS